MIKLCHSVIVKLNDQPWWILIRHEHRRKQIYVLLTRKMIKKIHNYRPVSLCRKYLKYLWLKKKLTRAHSSHLGHQFIIWWHISWKRGICFICSSLFSLCSKIHLIDVEFPEFWHLLLVLRWKNGWIGFSSAICIHSVNFLCNLKDFLHLFK